MKYETLIQYPRQESRKPTSSIISESETPYKDKGGETFKTYDNLINNNEYKKAEEMIFKEETTYFIKSDKEIDSRSKKYNYTFQEIPIINNENNPLETQIKLLNHKYQDKLVEEKFATAFNYVFTYLQFHIKRSDAKKFDKKNLLSEQQAIILSSYSLIEFKMTNPTFGEFHNKYKEIKKSIYSVFANIINMELLCVSNNKNISNNFKNIEEKLKIKLDKEAIIKQLKNLKNNFNKIECHNDDTELKALIDEQTKIKNEIIYLVFYDIKCFEMSILLQNTLGFTSSFMHLCKSTTQFAVKYNYRSIGQNNQNPILEIIDFFNGMKIPTFTMRDANTIKNTEDAFKLFSKIDITKIIEECKKKENGNLFIGNDKDGYYLNDNFFLSKISDLKIIIKEDGLDEEQINNNNRAVSKMFKDIDTNTNAFTILTKMSQTNKIKSKKFMKAYEEILFTILIMEVFFFDVVNSEYEKVQNPNEYEPSVSIGRSKIFDSSGKKILDDSICIINPRKGNGLFYNKLHQPWTEFLLHLKEQNYDEYYDFPFLSYCINGSARCENLCAFNANSWLLTSKKHTDIHMWKNILKLFLIILAIVILIFLLKK